MKLIVDSGSTKTDWCFASQAGTNTVIQTDGINPTIQSYEEIENVINNQFLKECKRNYIEPDKVEAVFFYGAGCITEKQPTVRLALHSCTSANCAIEVNSDLLAACRALCGHDKGLACILGTGANSCYYDGKDIQQHTPALGYILGDEGSGAVLGRNFINGILKGWLPRNLRDAFMAEFSLSTDSIIKNVYRSSNPNRFLASTSLFISKHLDCKELEWLVVENFENFIKKNLSPYSSASIPHHVCTDSMHTINAVGSIAVHYRKQLTTAAEHCGYSVGKILKSPIEGLIKYHLQ